MKTYQEFINENFESKIYAYHYSQDEFEEGFILDSPKQNDRKFGIWKCFEQSLELCRKFVNKNAISRLNCLFSSPYKNNRFSNYGNCYLVEVIGPYFSADSRIIDKLQENSSTLNLEYMKNGHQESIGRQLWDKKFRENKQLYQDYWNGKLGDKKDIEILSNSLKIIEKVNIKESIFEVKQDFKINLRLLFDFHKLDDDSREEIQNSIDYNLKTDYYLVIEGILKKGSKFILKSNKKIQLLDLSKDLIDCQNDYIYCALFNQTDLKNCKQL